MEIRGPLPFHVARAYGVAPKPAPPQVASAVNPALVAARIAAPTDPDLGSISPSATGAIPSSFAMYTRAADRVDVATQVALGRSIDARG